MFLQFVLKLLARSILRKYQPTVVGITGSIGKTSTKEAVFAVLSGSYETRRNIKNYNNEIGVPLTILGVDSPGGNLLGWFKVIWTGIRQLIILNKDYPEVLVLEMAADHPGDIAYLTRLAPCQIGIITTIAPVHLEFFQTLENVRLEKQIMVTHLQPGAWAIINGDCKELTDHLPALPAQVMTYGINPDNKLWASEIGFVEAEKNNTPYIAGLRGKLHYAQAVVPFYLPGILGDHYVYSALAAAAAGIIMDINLVTITERLRQFQPPLGRLNLLAGLKQSWLIDDTYNSSPQAAVASLRVLKIFPKLATAKKIVVLGDMNELGDYTEAGHKLVGQAVVANEVDCLVTFGEKSKIILDSAIEQGFDQAVARHFNTPEELIVYLKKILTPGDVVLLKGSQAGIRLEKVVKAIMAHPESAQELLVRQGPDWD